MNARSRDRRFGGTTRHQTYTISGKSAGSQFTRPGRKGSTLKWLLFAAMALVLSGLTAGLYFFWPFGGGKKVETTDSGFTFDEDFSAAGFDFVVDRENRKILYINPPFTINLSGLEGKHLLRLWVWMEVSDMAVAEELNDDVAKFRFIIDDILSTVKEWTYAELVYGNGIDRLKAQLRDHINQYLVRGKVVQVLFGDIQFDTVPTRALPVRPKAESQESPPEELPQPE